MGDTERAAVARYKLESEELLRDHRRLATQLELIDRALERLTNRDRQQKLLAERLRITDVLAHTQQRLRACWNRSRTNARRPG
jgi:hypothetical protein